MCIRVQFGNEESDLSWFKIVSSIFQDLCSLMGRYNHSTYCWYNNDLGIKKCPITSEQADVIFVAQQVTTATLGSFSKPRRRRRRERRQTKGLMSKPIAVHVRFESLYISLPSSAKQQREMIKFYVFWRTRTAMANFWYLLLEMIAVGACLAWANF